MFRIACLSRAWSGAVAALAAASLIAGSSFADEPDSKSAEESFAYLLLGRDYRDSCIQLTSGARNCPPRFSTGRFDLDDGAKRQHFIFEKNRCIIRASTTIVESGQTYEATIRIHNIAYLNPGRVRGQGPISEYGFFLQGEAVVHYAGKDRNVLELTHRYRQPVGDIRPELERMRSALKAYQDRFCPAAG